MMALLDLRVMVCSGVPKERLVTPLQVPDCRTQVHLGRSRLWRSPPMVVTCTVIHVSGDAASSGDASATLQQADQTIELIEILVADRHLS